MGVDVASNSSISTVVRAVEAVRPPSGERVPAKRKATALNISTAKKECRFGGGKVTLDYISNGYNTKEYEESLLLPTAPSHFASQPASS